MFFDETNKKFDASIKVINLFDEYYTTKVDKSCIIVAVSTYWIEWAVI